MKKDSFDSKINLMPYQVFARKFRPQTFEDVVGQEPITTTLKNAIAKKRIAQSFLFTGSRGVGKTSTARIFAKALNCEKGPTPNPCNQCSVCEEITQCTSLDVLEIDGASNRGIDEIRNLRENVKFKPAHARFKIYIIDEVHMLTGEAFNALLKTLEEPPEHVKFIFATTEVHKLPLTILSRCQRFNFRRIPTHEIVQKLKEIAKQEKIKANEKVLYIVAKSAEGSLRDGESLLDQLASFGEGELKESDVTFSLGLTEEETYFSLLKQIQEHDSKSILHGVSKIVNDGKDLMQFTKGLLELFRNLLVLKFGSKTEDLVEGTEDQLAQLQKYKEHFTREELLFILTLLQQVWREIRWSETPRFLIEACLLKIANRSDLKSIDEILKEIKSKPPESSPALKKKAQSSSPRVGEDKSGGDALSIPPSRPSPLAGEGDSTLTLADVGRVWPDLVERVKSLKMSCGTFLSEAELTDVVDGFAVFGFPAHLKFHKEALEKQDNKDLIRKQLVALLGKDINVSFVVKNTSSESFPHAGGGNPQSGSPTKTFGDDKPAKESDIITSALDIFQGGKVIYKDV